MMRRGEGGGNSESRKHGEALDSWERFGLNGFGWLCRMWLVARETDSPPSEKTTWKRAALANGQGGCLRVLREGCRVVFRLVEVPKVECC